MRFALLLASVASTIMASTTLAQPLTPTAGDVAQFTKTDSPSRDYKWAEQTEPFDRALLKNLKLGSIPKAAAAMAQQTGLPSPLLEQIIALRVFLRQHQYDRVVEGNQQALRQRVLAMAPQIQGHELGILLLAEMLSSIGDDRGSDVDTLLAAAPDKARLATLVAPIFGGQSAYAHAATLAGPAAMPVLIRWARSGDLDGGDKLALYEWLASPIALEQVNRAQRSDFSVRILRQYLSTLLHHGLDAEAMARLDAMDPVMRERVLSPTTVLANHVIIADIETRFDDDDQDFVVEDVAGIDDVGNVTSPTATRPMPKPVDAFESDAGALRLDLAESYVMANRPDTARQMLVDLVDLPRLRAGFDCIFGAAGGKPEACGMKPDSLPKAGNVARLLLIDAALNRKDEDPYPIAEFMAGDNGSGSQFAAAQLQCRVFSPQQFPRLCETAMRVSYSAPEEEEGFSRTSPEEQSEVARTLSLAVPDYMARRARLVAAMPPKPAPPPGWGTGKRETVIAIAPEYHEQPIPPALLKAPVPTTPKGLAKLPPGFIPVRAERQGSTVITVSVSQTLDPVGEISQGGYWLHVSHDGGKHWERPLYTGLVARWPYVAKEKSALPLIAGDSVQLAVDVAEIDTASIIYPPVATRNRREVPDRFLTIPIKDLAKDSDNDGISDVVAHHLLLDHSDAIRPYAVGRDEEGTCGGPASPERVALMAVLAKMADPAVQAIIEPVKRTLPLSMLGWRRADAAPARPVMLQGRAEDFRCLRVERPVLVFNAAAIEAMKPLSPDFHAIDMPPIIFNHDKTRGYVSWSSGWAGGTLRLQFIDGRWKVDDIRQWIR